MFPLLFAFLLLTQQPVRPTPSSKLKTTTRMADEVLRDRQNRLLGTYFPRTNETLDATNRLVGRGNLLTTLL